MGGTKFIGQHFGKIRVFLSLIFFPLLACSIFSLSIEDMPKFKKKSELQKNQS